MHAVVDTNVFVSGLIGSGACRKVFLAFKEGRFSLIISEILFEELEFVTQRQKFHPLINSQERKEAISFIKFRAIFIKPKERVSICRDPQDNNILECALASRPGFIVTGDRDLLVLKSFRGIPIITPAAFLPFLNK
jgi:putative PIN family toxin of toxin-antitoxin system